MLNLKTVILTVTLALPMGTAMADLSPTATATPQGTGHACPTGEYDANYPGVPTQCVKCARTRLSFLPQRTHQRDRCRY